MCVCMYVLLLLVGSVKLSPLSGQVERQAEAETSGQNSQAAKTGSQTEKEEGVLSSDLTDTVGGSSSELWVGRGERPSSGYCVFSTR